MVKRWIAGMICALMMLSLLCGCGETAPAAPTAGDDGVLKGPTGQPLTEYTTGELDRKTLENALIQTALAYYNKGANVQYDISNTTIFATSRSGKRRLNCRQSPEQAAYDTAIYTSCSKYVFAVYHDAFDYEMPNYDTNWEQVYDMSSEGEIVVVKFGEAYGTTGETDRAKAIAELNEKILPGDVIFASPPNDPNGGHTMLYLGDFKGDGNRYVIHSWPVGGGNLDMKTGADKREPNGAITLQTLEELVLTSSGDPNYSIDRDKIGFFFLLRLFDASDFKECKLTPSAVTRMQYPNLVVDKIADRYIYDDVLPGEEITFTETVENRSETDYSELTVTEYVPEGATLVSAEGAVVSENALTWKLTLKAGEKQDLVYTVKNEKQPGEMLVFESGTAGMIPTRTMSFKVASYRLTEDQKAALAKITSDKEFSTLPASFTDGTFHNLDAMNDFYRDVLGIEVNLPATFEEYLNGRFKTYTPTGLEFKMFEAKDEGKADQHLLDMEINHAMTGQYLFTGTDSSGRIFDILPQYFQPGDLFITTKAEIAVPKVINEDVILYVNLGRGYVLCYDKNGTSIEKFSTTVQRGLVSCLFVGLRPSMAYVPQA